MQDNDGNGDLNVRESSCNTRITKLLYSTMDLVSVLISVGSLIMNELSLRLDKCSNQVEEAAAASEGEVLPCCLRLKN